MGNVTHLPGQPTAHSTLMTALRQHPPHRDVLDALLVWLDDATTEMAELGSHTAAMESRIFGAEYVRRQRDTAADVVDLLEWFTAKVHGDG